MDDIIEKLKNFHIRYNIQFQNILYFKMRDIGREAGCLI